MANQFGWFPDVEGLSLSDRCFDRGLSDDPGAKMGCHVLLTHVSEAWVFIIAEAKTNKPR